MLALVGEKEDKDLLEARFAARRVRELLDIDLGPERTPLSCREDPRFSRYFNHIWKELKRDG